MTLWSFALTLYSDDELKTVCLELQDRYGMDVCLLLSLCWLSACDKVLSESEYDGLCTGVRQRQIATTSPIRALRRRAKLLISPLSEKDVSHSFYQAVLALELQAERSTLRYAESYAATIMAPDARCVVDPLSSQSLSFLARNLSLYLTGFEMSSNQEKSVYQCFADAMASLRCHH